MSRNSLDIDVIESLRRQCGLVPPVRKGPPPITIEIVAKLAGLPVTDPKVDGLHYKADLDYLNSIPDRFDGRDHNDTIGARP